MRDLRLEALPEQELVEGAFELAAASGHRSGDVIENVVADLDRRILGPGRRQPQLQHAEAHRVVGRRHFERHAADEPGAHARLQRLQFRRRPVGGNDDLLGTVQQHVDKMAELVLDRLALQELHVVDDQKVDVAQLLLQTSARCCRGSRWQSAT